ncbi:MULTISPECIES: GNAT family N-acetyltransferase [Limosilactobacillus]|uniref:GNAT family N-acetyltransferase n=1 Tax=Limosilactobacillus TaxID=2742598 RepID=UPI002246F7CA|nr:GNAT family N-acetyltransferase [Limosilactobacillus pontis]MCX2187531.1 GNAT family N-acetyltransferase [Limosilactobacillus pontis]MCX2189276.1 GNAT family N-acetyltransferase [Limosilactobacillus pontis]
MTNVVLDEVRVAQSSDLGGVAELYKAICDHQPLDEYGADWTWGEYPSVDGLRQMIEADTLMIGIKDRQVVAGGLLTTGEEYPQVDWPHQFADDEVGILHLFGVHPKYRRTGISSELLQEIIKQAGKEGKQAVHLDVLAGNVPSEKLYVKNGFTVVQALTLHYDDIGDQDAKALEYCI